MREQFGVGPRSIPDYLALVGDTADGFPGLPGLGREVDGHGARPLRAPATRSPTTSREWEVEVRGAAKLAATLAAARDAAELFLDLATLRTDADVGTVDDWEWRGATPELAAWAQRLGAQNLVTRTERLRRPKRS